MTNFSGIGEVEMIWLGLYFDTANEVAAFGQKRSLGNAENFKDNLNYCYILRVRKLSVGMGLEDFYQGDKAFSEYSAAYADEWVEYEYKEGILSLVKNDVELARTIAFKLGARYAKWITSSCRALDLSTPLHALIQNPGYKG